jgi:hypothetical protein
MTKQEYRVPWSRIEETGRGGSATGLEKLVRFGAVRTQPSPEVYPTVLTASTSRTGY